MKTIRSLLILGGLPVAIFALGATVARAQVLESTPFVGTFTLPLDAQLGALTLPAGNYTLRYGHRYFAGPYSVEVIGEGKGSPHSVIVARATTAFQRQRTRSSASARATHLLSEPLKCLRSASPSALRRRAA